ncbi:hypothetical protein COCON_G00126660 [Conger conger]|uniref:Uncharacterized protein n=1 Tax=Conger conger TaxID=82655 RepID=A0A9Q1DD06_CONCO|nr:hypothetical protein COCON_G00126660 [Conger conger]
MWTKKQTELNEPQLKLRVAETETWWSGVEWSACMLMRPGSLSPLSLQTEEESEGDVLRSPGLVHQSHPHRHQTIHQCQVQPEGAVHPKPAGAVRVHPDGAHEHSRPHPRV